MIGGFTLDVEGSPRHVERLIAAVQDVIAEFQQECGVEAVMTESGVRYIRRSLPVNVTFAARTALQPFRGEWRPVWRAPRRTVSV